VERLLRRWAWRRRGISVGAVLLVAVLILADRSGWLLADSSDWKRYHDAAAPAVRAIDGDTLDIELRDGDARVTRLRLWGVDTPERARPDLSRDAEPFADEAWRRVAELTRGQTVRLSLEPQRVRDRYDRVLAYVTLPDGTVLNEVLLAEGLAYADNRWPHREAGRYKLIEEDARRAGRGFWAQGEARPPRPGQRR
jgi:micrococcal nuclease